MKNSKKIIHRLKIAHGHLEKVIEMMEEGAYCIDVVHQSKAVQAALRKADNEILRNHMETCMADSIRQGEGKKVIAEMAKVLEKNV